MPFVEPNFVEGTTKGKIEISQLHVPATKPKETQTKTVPRRVGHPSLQCHNLHLMHKWEVPDPMMPIVTELIESLRYVGSSDPALARLGIILIDNATELLIQRACTEDLHDLRMISRISRLTGEKPPNYEKAKSQDFSKKLSHCVASKRISEQEGHFILIVHRIRNLLYHGGQKHLVVAHAVSRAAFRVVVKLIKSLSINQYWTYPRTLTAGIQELESDAERLEIGYDQVLLTRLQHGPSLSRVLSDHIQSGIESIKRSIEFLNENPFMETTETVNLLMAQLSWDYREEKAEDLKLYSPNDIIGQAKAVGWKPRYLEVPYSSWEKRAAQLGKEPSELVALTKYWKLHDEVDYLASATSRAASELDEAIGMEVDRLRGK